MKSIQEPELKAYFALMEQRPELFAPSERIPIERDLQAIRGFTARTGKKVGVLYQSKFNMLVTDLICPKEGEPYLYERVIPAAEGGVVVVAVYEGKLVLLRQFRHALRQEQVAFIRGCGEPDLSPEANAQKEVWEEIGANVLDLEYLGRVSPDSGLTSTMASVYLCQVSCPVAKRGYEGIEEPLLLSQGEFDRWVAQGRITDGFSLAAYTLYQSHLQSGREPTLK